MKKLKIFIVVALIAVPNLLFAADLYKVDAPGTESGGTIQLPNPLGSQDMTFQQLIGQVIKGLLGIVGSLTLVMFVWGGYLWIVSGGNQQRIDTGKNILAWSSIGLAIIFSSYALVKFVITSIGG